MVPMTMTSLTLVKVREVKPWKAWPRSTSPSSSLLTCSKWSRHNQPHIGHIERRAGSPTVVPEGRDHQVGGQQHGAAR